MLHVSRASAVHADALGPIRLSRRNERRRLYRHFRRVLRHLRRNTPSTLTRVAKRRRARHLAELERYRRRGLFPLNEHQPGRRVPIFVDEHGTDCAMGHLIRRSGGGAIVDMVAANHNLARVHELAAWPVFAAWLASNGLTVDEAALIQPAYCEAPADCTCAQMVNKGVVVGTLAHATTGSGGAGGAGGAGADGLVVQVSAVHGNVGDIVVGDELEFQGSFGVVDVGDQVVAQIEGADRTLRRTAKLSDGEVQMEMCTIAVGPPGPLPLEVYVDAATATSPAHCEAVLRAHDSAWTEEGGGACDLGQWGQGDFNDEDEGSTAATSEGCSLQPGGAVVSPSAGLFLVGAAGLMLLRRRRR